MKNIIIVLCLLLVGCATDSRETLIEDSIRSMHKMADEFDKVYDAESYEITFLKFKAQAQELDDRALALNGGLTDDEIVEEIGRLYEIYGEDIQWANERVLKAMTDAMKRK